MKNEKKKNKQRGFFLGCSLKEEEVKIIGRKDPKLNRGNLILDMR